MVSKKLVSDIEPEFIYDTPMFRSALKKASNDMVEDWNKLNPDRKIPITPLTEEEELLVKQFEQFVQNENT